MVRKLSDIEQYSRQKRYERYDNCELNINHLSGHRVANRILVLLVKIQRLFKRQELIVINDKRQKTDKAIIFSPTHIGGLDIEMTFEAIHMPSWLMLADPREMYRSFSGAMLDLNGVIVFDSEHKRDRFIAKKRSIELLNRGENLIIFSEGAYNISPNELVMHPYAGTVEIAIETGADIVPIAIVHDGNKYYMNIGENYNVSKYSINQKYELTEQLRNKLATLIWDIIEQLPITNRNTIEQNYYEDVFIKEMFADIGEYTYTINDVRNTLFKPKYIVESSEAFSFMKKLNPKRQNAFLFRN